MGNYVKVVQRVPVKIIFDEPLNRSELDIAPGMSVEPKVTDQMSAGRDKRNPWERRPCHGVRASIRG